MSDDPRRGVVYMLLAAVGYSFFSIWVKAVQAAGMTPLDIALWRFLLAAPLFWLALRLLRLPPPERRLPRLKLLGVGTFIALAALSAFTGLQYLPASTFIVLFYTYPSLVAILSALLGDRLPPRGWAALGLTLLGVALTVPDFGQGLSDNNWLGVILALFNAFVVAAYYIVSGRVLRGYRAINQVGAYTVTGALLVFLALAPFRTVAAPPPDAWGGILGLATLSTVFPVFFLNRGIQQLGAPRAAILGMIEPILTLTWAALLLGERMRPAQLVGGALILASIALLQLPGLARGKPAAAAVERVYDEAIR